MTRVSIVTTLYNKEDSIPYFLAALARQSYAGSVELLVVDDASTDASVAVFKKNAAILLARFSIKLLQNRVNAGNCVSRNAGIAAATGDILIITDADCVLSRNFVETYVRAYETPGVVAVVSDYGIELGVRKPLPTLAHFESHPWQVSWWRRVQDSPSNSFLNTVTRGFSFRRGALAEPVYDVAFNYTKAEDSGYGWEDVDVGCRLHQQGTSIAYAAGAFSLHMTHPPVSSETAKPLRSLQNFALLHRKHPWLATEKKRWSRRTYGRIFFAQAKEQLARTPDNDFLEQHLSVSKTTLLLYKLWGGLYHQARRLKHAF